jgi:hypothetical protein
MGKGETRAMEGQVALTGDAKSELVRMLSEKTLEEGALPRAGWPRENQGTRPMGAEHAMGQIRESEKINAAGAGTETGEDRPGTGYLM